MEVYSNAGQRWTLSEEESLIQNWPTLTVEELSKRHGRTKLAITARLQKLGFIPLGLNEKEINNFIRDYPKPDKDIIEFLQKRRIVSLFHFTSSKNFRYILDQGFKSKNYLVSNKIPFEKTDSIRNDGILDGISFSLSTPNLFMLHNKVNNARVKGRLIILELDSIALAFVKFKAFPTNAANESLKRYVNKQGRSFEGLDGLKHLYLNEDLRHKFNIGLEEPTDLQSEIVVIESCPSYFIKKIHFKDELPEEDLNTLSSIIASNNVILKNEIEYNSPLFIDIWSTKESNQTRKMYKQRRWNPTWEVIDGN